MTANDFFEHLATLADAPGGIPNLRELILQLAIQGKLLPQDRADESVEALLEKIHAEKRTQEKRENQARTESTTNGDLAVELVLPDSWKLVCLDDISTKVHYGYTASANHDIEKVRMLRITDIQDSRVNWPSVPGCEIADEDVDDYRLEDGDVLIARTGGTIGKSFLVHQPSVTAVFASYLIRVIPSAHVSPAYVKCFLDSPWYWQQLRMKSAGTGQPNVNATSLKTLQIPLPPLAEQKRIVAKVDRLMVLCDALEARQQARHAVRSRLHATLLGNLQTAANAADFARAWQRLRDHFAELFTPGEAAIDAVAQLRQTILCLAVQGKLVAQDATDESAQRSFPGLNPLISKSSDPNRFPDSWDLCTYRSLTSLVTSGSRGWKEFYSSAGAIFVRTQNIKTDSLVLDDVAFVDLPKSAEGMRAQVLKDDILITVTGANVTKAALVQEQIPEAYVSQHIALTRPRWSKMSEWLHLCFISHGSARGTLEKLAYGDKPGLNLNNIRDLELPIPPLAEQQRIVAKVQQLMAQCDALEASLKAAATVSERWSAAAVRQLLDGAER